jgi:hypothetical protein
MMRELGSMTLENLLEYGDKIAQNPLESNEMKDNLE